MLKARNVSIRRLQTSGEWGRSEEKSIARVELNTLILPTKVSVIVFVYYRCTVCVRTSLELTNTVLQNEAKREFESVTRL